MGPLPTIQAPKPSTELATQSSPITAPSTADIKREGTQTDEDESKEHALPTMNAHIESLKTAKKACRDNWKDKMQEAKKLKDEYDQKQREVDAAMGRYLELEDERESLEGRRKDQLRVEE